MPCPLSDWKWVMSSWYFPSEGTERLPKTLTPKEKEKVETYKER